MNNVVVITLDSLRADGTNHNSKRLGFTSKIKTPNLDAFSKQGSTFVNAYSTNTYTTSAHASLFTGTYPPQHQIRGFFDFNQSLNKGTKTLAEDLLQHNFQTFFYSDVPELFSQMDIWRGFKVRTYNRTDWLWNSIEELKKERNLIFMHLFDIHEPYLFIEDKSVNEQIQQDYFDAISTLRDTLHIKSKLNQKKYPHDAFQEIRKKLLQENIEEYPVLRPFYDKGTELFDKKRLPFLFERFEQLGFNNDNTLFLFISDHGEGKLTFNDTQRFAHGGEITDDVLRMYCAFNKKIAGIQEDQLLSISFIKPLILHNLGFVEDCNLHYLKSDSAPQDKKYIYAESYLNYVGDKLPHGITDKGTIIKIATKEQINLNYILKNRGLIGKKEKIIVNGKPEFVLEIDEYKDYKDLVFNSFVSFFSRYPSDYDIDIHVKALEKKQISINEFINRCLLKSDEKKQKPFISYYNQSNLSDKKVDIYNNKLLHSIKTIVEFSSNTKITHKQLRKVLNSELSKLFGFITL